MSTISNSRIKTSSIMFTDIVGYIQMGCLRPDKWNLLREDDDSRVYKEAEIDVGGVGLKLKSI